MDGYYEDYTQTEYHYASYVLIYTSDGIFSTDHINFYTHDQ
jgi:hypothetical protein